MLQVAIRWSNYINGKIYWLKYMRIKKGEQLSCTYINVLWRVHTGICFCLLFYRFLSRAKSYDSQMHTVTETRIC